MNLILKWLSWNLINIFDRNISSSFHGWKYTLSKAMYALSEPPRALISAIYRLGDKLGPHQNQCMTTSTRVIRTKVWSLNHPKSMGFSICILPPTWIVWANQRALALCEVVNHCFVLMLLCLLCLIMLCYVIRLLPEWPILTCGNPMVNFSDLLSIFQTLLTFFVACLNSGCEAVTTF